MVRFCGFVVGRQLTAVLFDVLITDGNWSRGVCVRLNLHSIHFRERAVTCGNGHRRWSTSAGFVGAAEQEPPRAVRAWSIIHASRRKTHKTSMSESSNCPRRSSGVPMTSIPRDCGSKERIDVDNPGMVERCGLSACARPLAKDMQFATFPQHLQNSYESRIARALGLAMPRNRAAAQGLNYRNDCVIQIVGSAAPARVLIW